jgi:hypothetical protein
MYFLIYSSKANHDISQQELHDILEDSKKNNAANEITGMLILYKDTFIQMLEGDGQAVKATFERIKEDDRHYPVLTLFEGYTDKRHFPDWKMALEVVDEDSFRKIDAYESLEEGDRFLHQIDDDHIGLRMLKFFYDQKKTM